MSLSSPIYQLPLTDEQLALIGRITLMWGHIDTHVDIIIMRMFSMGFQQFDHLFGNKMVTPKCETIITCLERISDESTRVLMREMQAAIATCVRARNTMTHGLWGWEWKENAWNSMAFSRSKNSTFYASELADLHEKISVASEKTDKAFCALIGSEIPNSRNRAFYVTNGIEPTSLPPIPQGFAR